MTNEGVSETSSPAAPKSAGPLQSKYVLWGAGAVFLALFWITFAGLMPSSSGKMGHDFSGVLPGLLIGRIWFEENGLFVVPWFVPSLCGGVFWYANVNSMYYSLPQALTIFMSPLQAVQVSFVAFGAIGALGAYLLVRRSFQLGAVVALCAAVLMLFNGFYAYRSLIGHFTFHSFMLIPLMCFLALSSIAPQTKELPQSWRASAVSVVAIAFCWVYAINSGGAQLIPYFTAAIALVILVHGLVFTPSWRPWLVMTGGGLLGLLLGAAKLNAMGSLVSNFERDAYRLPGASDMLESAGLIFRSLFFFAPKDASAQLENVQWELSKHEWEFGLSPVALVLLLAGLFILVRAATGPAVKALWANRPKVFYLFAAIALGVLPIALNTYGEEWNAFLKSFPIIGNMSSMVRWISIYIPVLVVLCAISLARWFPGATQRTAIAAVAAMAGVVIFNVTKEKTYYAEQGYSPADVQSAYKQLAEADKITPIQGVGAFIDTKTGTVLQPLNRNDTMVSGWSQLACYEPQFGYRLEWFPQKTLQPGPATDIREGRYNFKDPSCYVFPEANKCEPGDHFKVGEEQRMQKLLNYQPYEFRFSQSQEIANLISLVSWLAAGLVLAVALFAALRRRLPNTKAAATASPGRDAG